MWPPGHLALGYLVYTALRHVIAGRSPVGGPTVAVAVGTQFPDLVDKPLSWTLGLLPTGRSLTHSAVTATVVSALVVATARRIDRPALGFAFVVGYWTHLIGDLYSALMAGEAETNWFWLWPLVPQERYATVPSFLDYAQLVGWGAVLVALALLAFAVVAAVASERVGPVGFWLFVAVFVTASTSVLVRLGSPSIAFELAVVQAAVAVWVRDGAPGVPNAVLDAVGEYDRSVR